MESAQRVSEDLRDVPPIGKRLTSDRCENGDGLMSELHGWPHELLIEDRRQLRSRLTMQHVDVLPCDAADIPSCV